MREYTDEEKTLKQYIREANPYSAPAGYFDALPDRVMHCIHARQRRKTITRWAAAAMLAGCVATVGFTLLGQGAQDADKSDMAHAQYIDEVLDYTMIDNAEIAYYLTEAE